MSSAYAKVFSNHGATRRSAARDVLAPCVHGRRRSAAAMPPDAARRALRYSSTFRIAMKASCGTSTDPMAFMRFLPSFCFSSSLRLREMSPP